MIGGVLLLLHNVTRDRHMVAGHILPARDNPFVASRQLLGLLVL